MASQVHLIFLYHPAADPRNSPLPDAIVRRLEGLYQTGGTCTIHIAHIRYGQLATDTTKSTKAEGEIDLQRFLSSTAHLALSPFVLSSVYWQQREASAQNSIHFDIVNSIREPREESFQDTLSNLLEQNETPESQSKANNPLGCLADGLVAALEVSSA
jgi:hypothetical protein